MVVVVFGPQIPVVRVSSFLGCQLPVSEVVKGDLVGKEVPSSEEKKGEGDLAAGL